MTDRQLFHRVTSAGGGKALGAVFLALALAACALPADAGTLSNGGFESGDFTGWTTDVPSGAEAAVLIQHIDDDGDPWNPVGGTYFARLKTDGPGSYTQLSRTLTVTAGENLEFDWFFDAGDYAPYNDHVRYQIMDDNWTVIYAVTLASVMDGGIVVGDYGETGWHREMYTFSSNGTYTFAFGITNDGDSAVDSYAGIDNVTPEPATLVLLALGGLASMGRRRKARGLMAGADAGTDPGGKQ